MPQFSDSKELSYSASFLFDIVVDIESYPLFLPWVQKAAIIERYSDYLLADLTVGNTLLSKTYRSKVTTHTNPFSVHAKAIEGPFHFLNSNWHLINISEHKTKVSFDIDFEINSSVLANSFAPLFKNAIHEIMSAFESRARILNRLNGHIHKGHHSA